MSEPTTPSMVEVGRRLAQARAALGLTQAEAAARAGVVQVTWSHWEHGQRMMRAEQLLAAAQALEVEAAVLLPDGPPPPPPAPKAWRVGLERGPLAVRLHVPERSAELEEDDILQLRHALALAYYHLTGTHPADFETPAPLDDLLPQLD